MKIETQVISRTLQVDEERAHRIAVRLRRLEDDERPYEDDDDDDEIRATAEAIRHARREH